jgi:hypothetical protein
MPSFRGQKRARFSSIFVLSASQAGREAELGNVGAPTSRGSSAIHYLGSDSLTM